ncbi:hypothetical protein [Candidatus Berkiella aquae]|uniref:Uncharacterized protein n=1 Tax=Candidatus Berkiella aquae TaxID=295108 RepID=A0A0Q9Z066_9GAMM|nr:hypothetical protein [Candidatus Berkiella aquae]MCS5710412.1 hypothetical protein [Candidatus Berkiella aquae]
MNQHLYTAKQVNLMLLFLLDKLQMQEVGLFRENGSVTGFNKFLDLLKEKLFPVGKVKSGLFTSVVGAVDDYNTFQQLCSSAQDIFLDDLKKKEKKDSVECTEKCDKDEKNKAESSNSEESEKNKFDLIEPRDWAMVCIHVMQNAQLMDLSNFDVHVAWRVLLHTIKHNSLYLLNDEEPEAGSEDEIENQLVENWKNFLGQLCQLRQNESAKAFHNFIHLLHKTSLAKDVNKMHSWNLAEVTSSCIDDALEFTGKIGTRSNVDRYGTHQLKKELVCLTNILYLLIKNPHFALPFDVTMYINSEQKEFAKEKKAFSSLLEDLGGLTCDEIKDTLTTREEAHLKNMPLPDNEYNATLMFSKKEKSPNRTIFSIPKTPFRRSSNSESPRATESTSVLKPSPRKISGGNDISQGVILRKSSVNSNSPRKELLRKSSANNESLHTETESSISLTLTNSNGESKKEEIKKRKVTK